MLGAWGVLSISLVIILVGCDLFTNGVEWAGKKLSLSEGTVGSVLAAVGTCLPETLIALLAIFFGRREGTGSDVGIGAILGAPLMLSTLAFFVTGAAILIFHRTNGRSVRMKVNHRVVGRDLRYFFLVFIISALASFLPKPGQKYAVAALLVILYGTYIAKTLGDKRSPGADEDISPLHFFRKAPDPPLWMVIGQGILGLLVLVYGAHLFVSEISWLAHATGVPALSLSLIITPIATELPEKFNSVLWVRQKKDTLAIGNISGAMVFQSSIPPAIGMLFTDWKLNPQALACVVVAVCSSATVWGEMMWRKRLSPYSLLVGGIFYVVYLAWALR